MVGLDPSLLRSFTLALDVALCAAKLRARGGASANWRGTNAPRVELERRGVRIADRLHDSSLKSVGTFLRPPGAQPLSIHAGLEKPLLRDVGLHRDPTSCVGRGR
eukprot:1393831-Rhodomonas_salina.3